MKKILPWMLLLGLTNVVNAADFKPPLRGAPEVRIGGGSRAVTMQLAKVNLFAPKTAGATANESPVLYWHLSKAVAVMVEVKLTAAGADKPLFALTTTGMGAGLHKLSLAEYGVKLQAGTTYTWQAAIVWDVTQRNKDAVSSASLQYTPTEPSATALLPRQLLEKGLGYDAIAAISAQIEADPNNPTLREERAALLEQLGQTDAAKLERAK